MKILLSSFCSRPSALAMNISGMSSNLKTIIPSSCHFHSKLSYNCSTGFLSATITNDGGDYDCDFSKLTKLAVLPSSSHLKGSIASFSECLCSRFGSFSGRNYVSGDDDCARHPDKARFRSVDC